MMYMNCFFCLKQFFIFWGRRVFVFFLLPNLADFFFVIVSNVPVYAALPAFAGNERIPLV